jgi:cytochrome c-type biogenesis protein CcmH/NrfG
MSRGRETSRRERHMDGAGVSNNEKIFFASVFVFGILFVGAMLTVIGYDAVQLWRKGRKRDEQRKPK